MLSSIKMDKQLPYCMSQERTKGNLLQKLHTPATAIFFANYNKNSTKQLSPMTAVKE
jgi:hypothetical protein